MPNLTVWTPRVLSLLRIAAALSFMSHGTMKLLSFPAPFKGPMNPMIMASGGLELVGGALLVLGLFTRPVAFILSGMMAVAYFMVHVKMGGIVPALNQGEAAYLYTFVFLFLAVAGGGEWSLDAKLRKRP